MKPNFCVMQTQKLGRVDAALRQIDLLGVREIDGMREVVSKLEAQRFQLYQELDEHQHTEHDNLEPTGGAINSRQQRDARITAHGD